MRTAVISGISLVAGLALGTVLGMKIARPAVPTVDAFDTNGDGKADSEYIFENGVRARSQHDRNFDAVWDLWEWYSADGYDLVRAEADDDFNGKVDGWTTYQRGTTYVTEQDLDGNGITDLVHHGRYGMVIESAGRPKGSLTNAWVMHYKLGSAWKEYRDRDGDGLLDHLTIYDVFGAVLTEERIDPPLHPTAVNGGE